MTRLPRAAALGIPEYTPVHAVYGALQYHHADKEPVYLGALANTANALLRRWGKPGTFMESSIQRFLRVGHVNSVGQYLPAGFEIVCGKNGVKRGHVRVRPPQAELALTGTGRNIR